MPKPPIDPDSFDKVNFIIDSWTTGCDAPWYIYLETMKPAALTAFIALITFGWADVLRGLLRPKGLDRRTSKRKGKWAKRIPAFPELGNTIGKHLPFAEQIEDFTNWGTPTKGLWRIDTVMQHALFLWLVVDVAEDFVFNWTSLLYESYWCQDDPPGKFSWSAPGLFSASGGNWHTGRYTVLDYQDGPPFWTHTVGRTAENGATVAATVTTAEWVGFPPPTESTVQIMLHGTGTVLAETHSDTPNADGSFRVPVSAKIPPHTEFSVRHKHEPSWALVGDGVVVGVETLPP